MSGSGLIARAPAKFAEHVLTAQIGDRIDEREDILAYLARKKASAESVAEKMAGEPSLADPAKWAARQFAVLIDDIGAGLHCGEVEKSAEIEAAERAA